jgi:glycosyltransferase involved in cell wall biosynthesis
MDCSILIPTLRERSSTLSQVVTELRRQLENVSFTYELLIDADDRQSTLGNKRNRLVREARSEYIVFLEDDDFTHPEFFKTYEPMFLSRQYDVGEIYGLRYDNEVIDRPVHYSVDYVKHVPWYNSPTIYIRSPCHITPMRTSLARTVQWPDITWGEDHEFSYRLQKYSLANRPLVQFPAPSTVPMYHYFDNMRTTRASRLPIYNYAKQQFDFEPYEEKPNELLVARTGPTLHM